MCTVATATDDAAADADAFVVIFVAIYRQIPNVLTFLLFSISIVNSLPFTANISHHSMVAVDDDWQNDNKQLRWRWQQQTQKTARNSLDTD